MTKIIVTIILLAGRVAYSNNSLVTFKLIDKIKATPGITGLILWIAHINIVVLHLDVGLSFPNE